MSNEQDLVYAVLSALHPDVATTATAAGGATGEGLFSPRPEHRGNPGWLHGGLAATVLDHVCARICSAAMGERVVTGKLQLRYRNPVSLAGGPYRVAGEAEAPRGRMVKVAAAIEDQDGKHLVQAKGLFVIIRGSSLSFG
jgi:acyl-coenzyme A thioesterase PaaI-like protein